jgi:hypothetical protein
MEMGNVRVLCLDRHGGLPRSTPRSLWAHGIGVRRLCGCGAGFGEGEALVAEVGDDLQAAAEDSASR